MKKRVLTILTVFVLAFCLFSETVIFIPNGPAEETVYAAQQKKTGLYKSGGTWKYYLNGKFCKVTGIAQKGSGKDKKWYYVKDGKLNKATTIAMKVNSTSKKQYFVKKGVLNKKTGDVKVHGKKYRLYKGVVQGNQWKSVYRRLLNKKNLWNGYSYSSDTKNVVIKNIGGNSIPELLFIRAEYPYGSINAPVKTLDIYTCINGKAKKVKSIRIGVPAAGWSAGMYQLKNGNLCFKERYGDEYTTAIVYTQYSLKNGKTLKQVKKTTIEFKEPHQNDGSYTWHYMTKMYLNGAFYQSLNSSDAYSKAINETSEDISGFSKNVKYFVLGTDIAFSLPYIQSIGMTETEAYHYLAN